MKHLKLFESFNGISIDDVVDRCYPELKKMIEPDGIKIGELARAIDKRWEGPYDDAYKVRNLISDALDEVGASFNYDKLTDLIINSF